jgi:hypothetical protein
MAAGPPSAEDKAAAVADLIAKCRPTTSYIAGTGGIYRGQKLEPKKLTELPPGTTYMAVFRHIGSCEAPLTMVEYRNARRR